MIKHKMKASPKTPASKVSGKGYQQAASSSEAESWMPCSSPMESDMIKMKEELEALRQENEEMQLQLSRSKTRKEM